MLIDPDVVAAAHAMRDERDEPLCAYIYDLDALDRHVRYVRSMLPASCELFYAVKANPESMILNSLAPLVDGFEVSSGGEVAWVVQHGSNRQMIFGGPGKLDDELALAIRTGVATIHVESVVEIHRLARLAEKVGCIVPVLIRLNPTLEGDAGATRLMMAGTPTPFGIDEGELENAIAAIRAAQWLRLDGFHVHARSHQLDATAHADLIAELFRRFGEWEARAGERLPKLNVGGGIGVDYADGAPQFDWPLFSGRLTDAISRFALHDRVIRFELGRHLTAFCGCYASEIIDLKSSRGHWFAVCRGGTHHFRLPVAQGHDHPLQIVRRGEVGLRDLPITFVGQLCTPKDVFARKIPVAEAAIGDLVLFPLAGAYAWNISHQNFLMHPPPTMRFLRAKQIKE